MKNLFINIAQIILILVFGLADLPAQEKVAAARDEPQTVSISGEKAIIPMELYGRKPVVEVKINGKGPYKFFLDTGAGATVFNQDLADELKLPVKGTTKIGDPADPQGITANRNAVEKFEIGGATFSDFIAVSFERAALYQPGAPRGVVGMPLFRALLLTVDYPNNKILIAKGGLPKADGGEVLDYQPTEGGLFGVTLDVAGERLLATLDTGSQSGLSFPNSYMERLPLSAKPVEIGRGRTVGGEAVIYGAKLNADVRLGRHKFEKPDVRFFGRLRHLNLGYDFLNQFAVTVDQQNKRLKFEKTTPPAQTGKSSSKAPPENENLDEYAGTYGERRLSVEQGSLYLQRLSGPQGAGPKIKLKEISKDAFALDGTSEVRIKFVRGQTGNISELQVLTPAGSWESAKKTN